MRKKVSVTCDFLGRLGNNMFQVAAMIGFCKKNGRDYGIPIGYKYKGIYNYFNLPKHSGNSISGRFYIHDESVYGFPYHDIPTQHTLLKLRGFFQSEKYFLHCADEIKNTFKLDIKPTNRISIHVRRGDYLKYPNNFVPTTLDDIQKVVEYFGYNEKYLIVSDDIHWCMENLCDIRAPFAHFEFSHGNEIQDLSAMASCQHHVVSRSSFSWWGAWLGHNPNKQVLALTPWFGKNNNLDTRDVIPDNWIKI